MNHFSKLNKQNAQKLNKINDRKKERVIPEAISKNVAKRWVKN